MPVVVLVDRGTASSAEIVTGALQDRHRAEVVGTNTYGKGVFQEIRELPNGGALDLTVGQYFLPSGRNIGGRGVAEGRGIAPDVRASDDPDTTRRDEALDAALAQLVRRVAVTRYEQRERERERAAPRTAVVAVLDKRGRFLVGEPFFGRGPQLVVDRGPQSRPRRPRAAAHRRRRGAAGGRGTREGRPAHRPSRRRARRARGADARPRPQTPLRPGRRARRAHAPAEGEGRARTSRGATCAT